MRVRYKRNREPLIYESQRLTTTPHQPPDVFTGPHDRCAGCPYPAHGFICWGGERCIRDEVARIMERDRGAL